MIVLDEQISRRDLTEAWQWYRGLVIYLQDLRSGTLIKEHSSCHDPNLYAGFSWG